MQASVEVLLADLSADQWGLVTAAQALAAGISRMQLSRMEDAGLVSRVAHGVYALRGSQGGEHLELAAAWLGLDPARPGYERLADPRAGAVVSHASAAALHGLGDLDADRHEFTLASRKQTRRPDVRLHRGTLGPDEVTRLDGLPVTTPVRTIADLLADGHDGGHVAGVLADAVRTRLVDLEALAVRVGRHAARYGLDRGNGRSLVAYLLELGGATEHADADRLVEVARTHRVTIGDLVAISDPAWYEQMAGIAAVVAAQREQLAPLAQAAAELARAGNQQHLEAAAAALAVTTARLEVPDATSTLLRTVVQQIQQAYAAQNADVLRRTGAALTVQLDDQIATINRALAPMQGALAAAAHDIHRQSWAHTPAITEALQTLPTPALAAALQALPAASLGVAGPEDGPESGAEDD